jgi:predicted permease
MGNASQTTRFRFWLWLIRAIGIIVPRRLRADWKQEWEAELRYRELRLAEWDNLNWRTKFDLLWRSLGALRDALWLQPQRLEDEMFQDLRYGLRMLLKHKWFTIVAVLSLGLGIGANTALFSLVDTVMIQKLPVAEPDRLVLFEWQAGRAFRTNGTRGTMIPREPGVYRASMFRYDIYEKLRQVTTESPDSPISHFFAFAPIYELTAVTDDKAEVVDGQAVSGGYYAGLGVEPRAGRMITSDDDHASAPPAVVLSYDYWKERFGANPDTIGQQLRINNVSFTIIGVTPAAFKGTLQVGRNPAVTVPISFEPMLLGERTGMVKGNRPGYWWINLMGRLKPGATIEEARDSLNGTFQAMALEVMPPPRRASEPAELEPKDYPRLIAMSGSQGLMEMRTLYSGTIYGLFIIVGLVLLIACANVANLLLSRAAMRGPEISLRLAVGAGRWRLIRQLLTESVLLAGLGGVVGVIFALWGKSALVAMAESGAGFLPNGIEPALNLRVLAFTLGVSLLTGVLFGLVPAWRATRLDLATALKQSKRSTGAVSRLSKGLVVLQVAVSLILLVGAGVFLRTVANLQNVNLGFNQQNLLLFGLQPEQGGYKDERLVQFYEQLFARLDSLPGVSSATFGVVPLISQFQWNTEVQLPGETEQSSAHNMTNVQIARENYFSAMEIPIIAGRGFTNRDDRTAPKVAIVSQTFAKKYFPNDEAIGKRIRERGAKDDAEIIGIVGDTKYERQRTETEPLMYTSWRQEVGQVGQMFFALRTTGEPEALAPTVRQVVRELDSNLPVTEMTSQEARSEKTLAEERVYARLLSFFGVFALVLAAIGLSGVLAYSVAQRTNEIGIRMALGAQPSNVLRLVIWQGMKLVGIGLVLGALGGYALQRLIASDYFDKRSWQREMADLLYDVKLTDPATFASIALLLIGVAFVACWLPARRASRVDPLVALRQE